MYENPASHCLRFLDSMESKMRLMIKTGDIVESHWKPKRSTRQEVDEKVERAKKLMESGLSKADAARAADLKYITLDKRLKKENG